MNTLLDFGLSEFVINHAKAMNKGANPHMGPREISDTVNQDPSVWSNRQLDNLHPGKDPNCEARCVAESMTGHVDSKELRNCRKEGAECCQFYECPPPFPTAELAFE